MLLDTTDDHTGVQCTLLSLPLLLLLLLLLYCDVLLFVLGNIHCLFLLYTFF